MSPRRGLSWCFLSQVFEVNYQPNAAQGAVMLGLFTLAAVWLSAGLGRAPVTWSEDLTTVEARVAGWSKQEHDNGGFDWILTAQDGSRYVVNSYTIARNQVLLDLDRLEPPGSTLALRVPRLADGERWKAGAFDA
jgi:hypothetical protein